MQLSFKRNFKRTTAVLDVLDKVMFRFWEGLLCYCFCFRTAFIYIYIITFNCNYCKSNKEYLKNILIWTFYQYYFP